MDKNTVIGLVLIGLVIFGFSWLNRPDPQEIEAQRKAAIEAVRQDSIAKAEAELLAARTQEATPDSIKQAAGYNQYGLLAVATAGAEEQVELANGKIALKLSTKGGAIREVLLRDYKTYDGKPLYLFREGESDFNLPLRTVDNRLVDTRDLYFSPISRTDSSVVMRLAVDSASYLDLAYVLLPDDYRLRMTVSGQNLQSLFPANMTMQDLEWSQRIRRQEKSWKFENQYTSIYYKYSGDEGDRLSDSKQEDKKTLEEPLHWVSFKDKYFASVLVCDGYFENNKLAQKTVAAGSDYLKNCTMSATFPLDVRPGTKAGFTFFFGPLKYNMLRAYDKGMKAEDNLDLDHLVYLGASIFRWINRYMIIPASTFLQQYFSNWGLIILLLTLGIKLLISPLAYKGYLSSAKMRLLRPQVQEINAKYPGKDQESMMKRQSATMNLYRAAGAGPMSGCLPMLLQFPFLIAMYMYFPTTIDIRQQSFLWAEDLSSYDAVFSWTADIPLLSQFYGNHVSLFCLLMSISNILYIRYTMNQSDTGQEGMAMLKWMPYITTVMFLFFFNQNASGLCYYYFLSSIITVIQYMSSRFIINEEKLMAKLEANKTKPRKKSKWMARLEEAQRQQEAMRRQQQKRK